VASARAAYLVGFGSTSNLEAGRDYGIPTSGTSAHAFSLVHDSERDAFAAQLAALGKGTTLLVDTFDVARAVRTAVELAGPGLGAVRIDSGDLPMVARQVRELLDQLGARDTKIVLSGDLNEYSIAALAAAPVDGYGVGTSLVTGSGAPTAALVYKLVARAREANGEGTLEPVAKRSVGKPGRGGRKWAARQLDENGEAVAELVTRADTAADQDQGPGGVRQRPLLLPLVQGGEVVGREPLDAARDRHRAALAELPVHALQLSRGYPAIPTVFVPDDE
jgi:nicotinate phosphoribosyltransferase